MRNSRALFALAAVAAIGALAFAAAHFGVLPTHVAGVAGLGGSLLALTVPPAFGSRNNGEQQVHFFRKRIQVAEALGAGLVGVKIGRLPARAYIMSVDFHVVTAFNSATSDTLQLGSTAAGVDILAATTVHATGLTHATSAAGLGLAVTASGEVDLFYKYVPVGGGTTTGDVTVTVAYIPDNDQ